MQHDWGERNRGLVVGDYRELDLCEDSVPRSKGVVGLVKEGREDNVRDISPKAAAVSDGRCHCPN